MIEAARALGVAARFVSGYVYVPKEEDEPVRLGGGATHAWCQIYLPGAGWVEFDPTNGLVGSKDLIRVAVARNPAQAAPLTGAYFGAPGDELGMEVIVDVTQSKQAEPVLFLPAPKSAPISRRRSFDRDNEEPRVGEQGPAVRLNWIGVLEAGAVAGEKLAALFVGEPLEERLQGRAGEPIGDALRPFERMNISRHPGIDARSRGPQPIVIIFVAGDEGLRLGDRHQARRPGSFGGDHPH